MNGWLIGGVAALMLAGTGGLIVQGGQLKKANAEVVRVEGERDGWKKRAETAEKNARATAALAATTAHEDALQCQGEGAELFEAGRRTGYIQGAARCPVP